MAPFRNAEKKINEENVVALVHKIRKEKNVTYDVSNYLDEKGIKRLNQYLR